MKRWPIVILFYRNPYKNFLTSQFGHHFLVIVTVADHEVFVGNWLLSLYIMLVQIFRNFMGGESVSRSHRSGWFRLRPNRRFLVFGLGFTSPCARFWAHLDLSSTVLIIVFFSLYFIKELDKLLWYLFSLHISQSFFRFVSLVIISRLELFCQANILKNEDTNHIYYSLFTLQLHDVVWYVNLFSLKVPLW